MYLTARERACLKFLGKGVASADAFSIGSEILKAEDGGAMPSWDSARECTWTGEVVAGSLETRQLVKPDDIGMWSITPKGRAELRQNRPSPNESSRVERYALADANGR